ncbi:xanthine dehydrogenase family protein subunit M [Ramlibacter ginsenosidimutans]|uniref:Xanthine dehydrogenase family protein subunit M n=1 Tax=Ramlibacter ginsenosidimutans TaxID=502333 RepID=A0A934WNE9_9BURK|nr:xanthine dehydrogenase family protein subunit M [Ramlibacter ginsenosidimutans]MBK6007142.1 xanthine dehydrogenase family protein subunit M [Ramlibacter ginsenosidimutans]
MNPFTFVPVSDVPGALRLAGEGTSFIAGGTNLIDLMKVNVQQPMRLVDINRLGLAAIEPTAEGGLRLGALARNAATAWHPLVRERYPLLATAILSGATAQIRNMASNGGNLLQRTRCCYFYDIAMPCNKRQPGSGCSAIAGLARQHAILGASAHCIATHPSDMCVALAALAATVQVASARGERTIPFADFHRLPGDRPDLDTTLAHDELILALTLPPADGFRAHSVYLKLRERLSYAFALVSVAAALDLDGGVIHAARVALGGVAHKPWRDPAAEALLVGQPATDASFARAADALLQGAVPQGTGEGSNAFKIPLARRAVVRALALASAGTVTNHAEDAP